MQKIVGFRWLIVAAGLFVSLGGLVAQEKETLKDKVVVVRIQTDDLKESQPIREWEQLLETAEKEDARAIIFDLNVKGDLPWASPERILESISEVNIPTISYVNYIVCKLNT